MAFEDYADATVTLSSSARLGMAELLHSDEGGGTLFAYPGSNGDRHIGLLDGNQLAFTHRSTSGGIDTGIGASGDRWVAVGGDDSITWYRNGSETASSEGPTQSPGGSYFVLSRGGAADAPGADIYGVAVSAYDGGLVAFAPGEESQPAGGSGYSSIAALGSNLGGRGEYNVATLGDGGIDEYRVAADFDSGTGTAEKVGEIIDVPSGIDIRDGTLDFSAPSGQPTYANTEWAAVAGSPSGAVYFADGDGWQQVGSLGGGSWRSVRSTSITQDGRYVAASDDRRGLVWDRDAGFEVVFDTGAQDGIGESYGIEFNDGTDDMVLLWSPSGNDNVNASVVTYPFADTLAGANRPLREKVTVTCIVPCRMAASVSISGRCSGAV